MIQLSLLLKILYHQNLIKIDSLKIIGYRQLINKFKQMPTRQSSSCPKHSQKSTSPSLSHLHNKLLQLQKNAIEERKKLISDSKKQLNRSWRNLCDILKKQDDPERQTIQNGEQQQILDACLQVIIKERISLEKENIQIERLRNLYEKSVTNVNSSKFGNKVSKKENFRFWKGKTKFLSSNNNY